MISPLSYVPRPGPLSRIAAPAALAYLLGLAAVAFTTSHPLVLGATAVAIALAGLLAGGGPALVAGARWAMALAVLIVFTNAVASQRGDTILVRGPELPLLGAVNVSAEALAEGGVLALRIAAVLAAFAVISACVDPDRILRLLRPLARRSALTATVIVRLVPLAIADGAALREAAALRGPTAAPVGRGALARRLVAGSLDRAIDVAATLELRGVARGAPGGGRGTRAPRGGIAFALAGLAALGGAVAIRLAGGGAYESYPLVAADMGAATLALAGSLPALALAPFAWATAAARLAARRARRRRRAGEGRRG